MCGGSGSSSGGGSAFSGGNIQWDASVAGGRYEGDGTIKIGPDFFASDIAGREYILAHEMGHGMLEKVGKEYNSPKGWDDAKKALTVSTYKYEGKTHHEMMGGYLTSGHNAIEEAAAHTMAVRALNPSQLKSENSKAYKWADKIYKSGKFSPEKTASNVRSIVPKLEPGPANSRLILTKY